MKKIATILFLIITGLLLSCGPSLKVSSDYDKAVDFTRYKTYALYSATRSPTISSLNQDRIIHAIRTEMSGKGLVEDSAAPDLLVNSVAILKNKTEVDASTNYYGYGGMYRPYYWGPGMGATYTTYSVQSYKEGSIIIDLVDAASKKLVWQGVGNSKIDAPLHDADTRIPAAIDKIMQGFPPEQKK